MKEFLKHWKTNLIAIVIISGLGYKAFTVGFTIADAVNGFIAIGFLLAKDFNKSNAQAVDLELGGDAIPPSEDDDMD